MLKTYTTLAWRHLRKNRGYTIINIAGLSIGMAVALIIGLWITDELSFDHYAPNHRRLAVGMWNAHLLNATKKDEFFTGDVIMIPLGTAYSTQFKDLFSRVALADNNAGYGRLYKFGDKTVSGITITAQPALPGMFGFQMLEGSADATKDPSTIIIAQSLATALFGKDDAIGKTVRIDNSLELHIGGVYADLPQNTTFYKLQAIFPWGNETNKDLVQGLGFGPQQEREGERAGARSRDHFPPQHAGAGRARNRRRVGRAGFGLPSARS